jgi:hypothetical protein
MVEVKWTRQAIGDVDRTAKYIATDSIKYAEIQVNRFLKVLKFYIINLKQDVSFLNTIKLVYGK